MMFYLQGSIQIQADRALTVILDGKPLVIPLCMNKYSYKNIMR